jgi:fibronectin type 3 domain-containing protein
MLEHLKRFARFVPFLFLAGMMFAQTGTQHGIQLTWNAVTVASGEPALAGYNMYRTVGSGAPVKLNTSPIVGTSYLDPNADLTAGTAYSYDVTAVDVNGDESASSNVFTITPTVLIVNPPAPSGCSGKQI